MSDLDGPPLPSSHSTGQIFESVEATKKPETVSRLRFSNSQCSRAGDVLVVPGARRVDDGGTDIVDGELTGLTASQ